MKNIPKEFIHEPWQMSEMESEIYKFKVGVDYPSPIVNLKESSKYAKEKIWGHLKNKKVKDEKKRILKTHVNQK